MDSSNNPQQKPAGQSRRKPRKRPTSRPAGGASNNDPAKPSVQKQAFGDGMKTGQKKSGGCKSKANPDTIPRSMQEKNQSGNHDKKASSNKEATPAERTVDGPNNNLKATPANKGAKQKQRKGSANSLKVNDASNALQPFKWQHPEGKDNIFQKEIMKYISLRPEDLGRLELEMKKANANVNIAVDHVAIKPLANFPTQAAGNWRKECERILDEFFSQFTVRTQTVDTFDPAEHNDAAVDVHLLSSLKGVLTISVSGRVKDVEQKIHQMKGKVNQMESKEMYIKPDNCRKISHEVLQNVSARTGVNVGWCRQNYLKLTGRRDDIKKAKLAINEQLKEVNNELRINPSLLYRVPGDFLQHIRCTAGVSVKWKGAGLLVLDGPPARIQTGMKLILDEISRVDVRNYIAPKWVFDECRLKIEEAKRSFPEIEISWDNGSICIRGHPAAVHPVGNQIEEVLRVFGERRICVKKPFRYALTGKVNDWQRRYGVGIQILPKDPRLADNDIKGVILITGPVAYLQNAVFEIEGFLAQLGEFRIHVKKNLHGALIGKNGSKVNEWQQKYGVVMEIPAPDSSSCEVFIRGENNALFHAKSEILSFIQQLGKNDTTLHVPLQRLHRLKDDFIKISEKDNNVQISKVANGVVIKGRQADVQKTNRDILAEVSIHRQYSIPAADWMKPLISDFLEQKHRDFPELRLDSGSMPDRVILEGHPSEGDVVAESLRNKVAEMVEVRISVKKNLHPVLTVGDCCKVFEWQNKFTVLAEVTPPKSNNCAVLLRGKKKQVSQAKSAVEKFVKEWELKNSELFFTIPQHRLPRICTEFMKRMEKENDVLITKKKNGMSVRGKPGNRETAKTDILNEVVKREHDYVSAKDWLKPMVMDSLREKQPKFPEMEVAFNCVVDQIVLTGHPYEVGIYANLIRGVVADVESKFTCEVIPVKRQLHGCIIGTKGSNIKRLQECFKVSVMVPSTESDSCEVTVQGSKEGVRDAVEDIQKMISHRDRNSKTVIRFAPHEKEDVKSAVALMRSQYPQVRTDFKHNSAIFTGPLHDVETLEKLMGEELQIKRRLRHEMQTISVPLTDSQALVLMNSREALGDIQQKVDSKVTVTLERQIPALLIKGDGSPLKEGHVKVVEQILTYNNYCVLDMKIDDSEMGKMIGKDRRNIKLMQSQHRVEIKTGTRGQINARKNITIIGKRPRVENVRLDLVYRYRAVTVGYQQYQGRRSRIQRHDSMASLSSINESLSLFSLEGDEDDRRSETSSVSDYAPNQQAVLHQWQAPSVDLLDFVKRSERCGKQFDGLFNSDESALIEETDRLVTVVGQATDSDNMIEFWHSTVDAKLQRFFNNFDSRVVQFHPKTTVDQTDIDDGELTVKWQGNACLVCGVKERVSEKLAEFEIIKNRKQSVAVQISCDKYLISFMRKNLNIEDEGFSGSGHVTLHSEHVAFQSEILEVDSVEDWEADCNKAIKEILQKLDCTKLDVPLLNHGHMRKECRHSDEVSVEWSQEDGCLIVCGWKDFVRKEAKRLAAVLYDLTHKKKSVTMRYRCDIPEIAAFIGENTEQLENLVKHMGPLGSPVLDGDTRHTFTMYGDILETESTNEWEEDCRVKIEQYFLRYKVLKINADEGMRGFCMMLVKSGSNVAVRWVENDSSLVIVGIKSLAAATEKSLRQMIEEESARMSLEHESLSVEVDKDTTLTVQASDSAFKWLEANKQRKILRDVKYQKNDAGIEISGKEGKVDEVKTLIESISVQELSMKKYGVYKFLKESSTSYLIEEIEINCNCVVQIDRLPDTKFGDEIYVQLPKKSIGSVTYEIKEGDITKEDVDVIVNTTNKSFSFDGPLSRAIFSGAGEDIRNILSTVYADIRYSDAGNLKCQKIIHVAIPKTNESMEDLLLKILRQADGMGMKSIALPAIGGGNGGWNNHDIAVAMRNAFEKFEAESRCLKKILVVLYGGTFVAYYQNILERKQTPTHAAAEQKTGLLAALARFFAKAPEPVPEPPRKPVTTPVAPTKAARAGTGQHAKVTVSADSRDNLKKAVEELQAMTDRFIKDFVIDSVAVLRISDSDLSKIEKMATKHDVRVIVNKRSDVHSITIQGNNDDASKVKDKVQEIIMSGISTDLPENWISSDEKMIPVKLDHHSSEYQEIEKLFKAANKRTGCYFHVERIDRIQNLSLYRQYQSKKEEISKRKTPPANVEMRLFHGTDKDTVDAICKHGFNRSYAGKNATMYGKGTYFSTESSYSNSYSHKDFRGKQHMFVAEVLTGDYCKGNSSMVDAPQNNTTGELYDSVVDQCGIFTPAIYVVFRDWSAYPSYVITYTSL